MEPIQPQVNTGLTAVSTAAEMQADSQSTQHTTTQGGNSPLVDNRPPPPRWLPSSVITLPERKDVRVLNSGDVIGARHQQLPLSTSAPRGQNFTVASGQIELAKQAVSMVLQTLTQSGKVAAIGALLQILLRTPDYAGRGFIADQVMDALEKRNVSAERMEGPNGIIIFRGPVSGIVITHDGVYYGKDPGTVQRTQPEYWIPGDSNQDWLKPVTPDNFKQLKSNIEW